MKTPAPLESNQRELGFTLIELMLTLLVVAVLAGLAAPNLYVFAQNSRIKGTTNDVLRSFQAARSEAVKRQKTVVVCLSDNPSASSPLCTTTMITAGGWITYQDDNNDWQKASTEPLIEANTFDPRNLDLIADQSMKVSFAASGFANLAGTTDPLTQTPSDFFVVCDKRGNTTDVDGQSVARAILISPTGRVQVSRSATAIDARLTSIGGTCPW